MGLFGRKKKEAAPPPAPKPKATVLVCTDNVQTVMDIRAVLEEKRDEFEIVDIVRCGDSVLEYYKTLRPDFIMLDNDLSGREGLDVLRELHETQPEAIVVFLAAFFESSAQEMVAKVVAYGAKQVLAKTIKGEVPAKNIRACLDKIMDAVKQKKAFEL